jgi:phage tail protein X
MRHPWCRLVRCTHNCWVNHNALQASAHQGEEALDVRPRRRTLHSCAGAAAAAAHGLAWHGKWLATHGVLPDVAVTNQQADTVIATCLARAAAG